MAKRAVCDPSLSVDIRAVSEFALRICYSTTKSMRIEDLTRSILPDLAKRTVRELTLTSRLVEFAVVRANLALDGIRGRALCSRTRFI